MRLSIAAILALGFAESATAFTPSSFSRAPTSSTKLYFGEKPSEAEAKAPSILKKLLKDVNPKAVLELVAKELHPSDLISFVAKSGLLPLPNPQNPRAVFEGVEMPKGQNPKAIPLTAVTEKIAKFQGPSGEIAAKFFNAPKTEFFTPFQDALIESQDLAQGIPDPKNYAFFGTDDHAGNLITFVKSNPFFAAGLTENRRGFELKSFDPKDPDAEDSPSLFRKMMTTLGGTGHRVNVHFDKKLTKIRKIEVFADTTGEKQLVLDDDDDEFEDWVCSAMYNLIFFSSCVHGTIHILHYLLTASLYESSSDYDELLEWAKNYAANIPQKYLEVGLALLTDNPNGTGTLPPSNPIAGLVDGAGVMADTYALVSGSEGFGARGQEITPLCQEMLQMWFENPTTFVDNMMNISTEKMDKAGILTEYRKHIALVKPFASEFSAAVSGIDSDKFADAQSKVKGLLGNVGLSSNINTLEEWTDIMCVTGIMHGSTISYTRAFSNANVVKWRNVDNDQWEAGDIRIVTVGLTTVTGMQEERHVFSPDTLEEGESYAKPMADVLEKYTAKSNELKMAYATEIMEDMDHFNKFGYILSDFCPTGFDGKQFTIATYI